MGRSLVEHLAHMRLEGCLDHLILLGVRQGVHSFFDQLGIAKNSNMATELELSGNSAVVSC